MNSLKNNHTNWTGTLLGLTITFLLLAAPGCQVSRSWLGIPRLALADHSRSQAYHAEPAQHQGGNFQHTVGTVQHSHYDSSTAGWANVDTTHPATSNQASFPAHPASFQELPPPKPAPVQSGPTEYAYPGDAEFIEPFTEIPSGRTMRDGGYNSVDPRGEYKPPVEDSLTRFHSGPVYEGANLHRRPDPATKIALELQLKNGKLIQQNETMRAEIERLQNKLADREAKLDQAHEKISGLGNSLQVAQQQNVQWRSQTDLLKQQICAAEEQRKREIEELSATISAFEKLIEIPVNSPPESAMEAPPVEPAGVATPPVEANSPAARLLDSELIAPLNNRQQGNQQ